MPSTSSGQPLPHAVDLTEVLAVAQQAGDLVLGMQARGLQNIGSKSSSIDLVTEADVAAEKLIRSELAQRYPAIGFWGEESNQPPADEYFWVVDPIDGTINFANGLAYFAVNIALNRGDVTLLGVTLELPARQLFFARLDGGAYRRTADGQDIPLHVNHTADLGHALLSTGFPYHRADHEDNNLAEFAYFLARTQGVRTMGTAAMDLANVACGATAAYWEGWLHPWDAAAGALLVREAGGKVTDYQGADWTITSQTLIASNGRPALHRALLDGIHAARRTLHTTLLPVTAPI